MSNCKRITAIILSLAIMLLTTSCNMIVKNTEEQFDYPVTVGNMVFEESPHNIAVLSGNIADVILACGYEGRIAAVSDDCKQDALSILPSVGTPDQPDLGMLRDLGIDFILSDKCFDDETEEKLASDGTKVLVIKPASDTESLGKLYKNVAASIAGGYSGKMNAMNVFEDVKSALESIKVNSSNGSVVVTSCYIYDITEDECVVATDGTFVNQLFDYASLTNIAAADDDGVIGIDMLLKANPDTIFCAEGVLDKLGEHKDLKTLKALSNGSAYELPEKYFSLQGATCVQVTDYIAAMSHSGYSQTQGWPDELASQKKEEKYEAPFEPQMDIYYTVGETYDPIFYIEERLAQLGYFAQDADESFDEDTADAISSFQAVNKLSVTGIADYATLKVLLSSKAVAKKDAGKAD